MLRSLIKARAILLSLALLFGFAFVAIPNVAYAEFVPGESGGQQPETPTEAGDSSAGTEICTGATQRCNHFIDTYINPFIYLLSGLVGIVAVISIIFAGIQYASSADDPGMVSKAKQRIFNTVIGLVAYLFLFAFLEYIIPGGIV